MSNDEKIYFLPGDVVTIKQDIPNKPTMLVVKKAKSTVLLSGTRSEYFQGILCRWFSTLGEIQEAVFNTKDLIKK